jgi:hypothetical protein
MRKSLILSAAFLLLAGAVEAEEITCKGSINSVQGEGLVNRTHRFEVADVTGSDVMAVLDKCRKIAQERQNRAARKNPAGNFRKFSDINLECVKGAEKFQLRRTLQTGP